MRLSRALSDKLMDVRLRDKLVQEGKLTKEDVQKYFASLPDDSSKAEYISDEPESDDDLGDDGIEEEEI